MGKEQNHTMPCHAFSHVCPLISPLGIRIRLVSYGCRRATAPGHRVMSPGFLVSPDHFRSQMRCLRCLGRNPMRCRRVSRIGRPSIQCAISPATWNNRIEACLVCD